MSDGSIWEAVNDMRVRLARHEERSLHRGEKIEVIEKKMTRLAWIISGFLTGLVIGVYLAPHAKADSWWQRPAVMACCSEADAVYADTWVANADGSISATVTGGGPRSHSWAPIGRTYQVPADRVLREPGNPTGRALLFIAPHNLDRVYCFTFGPMI